MLRWLAERVTLVLSTLLVLALAAGVTTYAALISRRPAAHGPNIVFVLTDDLSSDLVQYMPHVQALMRRGMTFTNYTVTDSLCCPSRASIFTGEFPHDTHVLTNVPPLGGWSSFVAHDDQSKTFAVALQKAGYRTGFVGKYLNGYSPVNDPMKPPGWDYWAGVGESGYAEYNYTLSLNDQVQTLGASPSDYLTTEMGRLGNDFLHDPAGGGRPFLLELATYTPHHPFVPAPQDRGKYPDITAPRGPTWDRLPKNPPRWLASHKPLTPAQIARIDKVYRLRVLDVLSVDRLVGDLENTLRAEHELADTVFVFSSDNGFHTGQYRLTTGKLTAFDTDVRVPLIVAGPHIPPGSTDALPVENIDLAPTFESLAHAPIPASVDGHDIVPLLHGGTPSQWRSFAGIEQTDPGPQPDDPDKQDRAAGVLPTYKAIRSQTFTYVEYADGEREYYDRVTDPDELDNVYATLSPARKQQLAHEVAALSTCAGYISCWHAAMPTPDATR